MNTSWINWYSKRQFTIKTSVFGAEFVTMKVGVDTLPDELTIIDILTSKPELTPKMKCNAIAFHAICESLAITKDNQLIY